jgi:hypothetical protein
MAPIAMAAMFGCSAAACPKNNGAPSAKVSPSAKAPVEPVEEEIKPPPEAPVETAQTRTLRDRLDTLRRGGRKKVRYEPPTPGEEQEHEAWVRAVAAAASEGKPMPPLPPAGFVLETLPEVVVLEEGDGHKRGAGALVMRSGAARPIVVEAPHTFFDSGTLPIALAVFEAQRARALLINTAHRYLACPERRKEKPKDDKKVKDKGKDKKDDNDEQEELEDKSEEKAKDKDEDKEEVPCPSDAAHAERSFFLAGHRSLLAAFPGAVTLQIHGFQDERVPGVGLIVSGSVTGADAALLARRLRPSLPEFEVRVYPGEVERLGGMGNVEAHASQAVNMHFFHLEISRSMRDRLVQDEALRTRFAASLDPLPRPPTAPRP